MTLKSVRYLCAWLGALVMLGGVHAIASAQNSQPERDKLLNGLSVLYWPRPGDANITVKLRINSGAAFDLADKAGTMSLLAEAMFPDAETREYVTEQLGGKMDVQTDYDSINVTITGKAGDLERIIELVRNAVINTNLSAEAVAKLRETRLKELNDHTLSNSEIADRAIAARLLGSFPYAQPINGSAETVGKIERADLMLAQERFLHADNASIAVIGGVEKSRVLRALRQLLGPWQKGDRTIPSTFRQPAAPDPRVLVIDGSATTTEVRVAVRGVSKVDRDSFAAQILAKIIRDRWQSAAPDTTSITVRSEEYVLPGMFVLSGRSTQAATAKAVSAAREIMSALQRSGPTAAEVENARTAIAAAINSHLNEPETIATAGLDVDTYRSTSASMNDLSRITVADVQRVASRLFNDVPVATVVVGNAEQLKTAFGANAEVRANSAELKNTSPRPTPKP